MCRLLSQVSEALSHCNCLLKDPLTGSLMAKHYVRFETMRLFSTLAFDAGVKEVMLLLSHAAEFEKMTPRRVRGCLSVSFSSFCVMCRVTPVLSDREEDTQSTQ